MKVVLSIISTLLVAMVVKGQDCKEILQKSLDKYKGIEMPEKKKAYHLKANFISLFGKSTNQPNKTVQLDIFIGEDKVLYTSDYMDLYKDKTNQFYVLKPQKRIIWRDPDNQNLDLRLTQIFSFQDSILSNSTILACTQENKTVNISIVPPVFLKNQNVEKITYTIESSSHSIKTVTVDFMEGHSIAQQKIEYLELDWSYPSHKLEPAIAQVFKAKNQLKEKYSDYQLIDSRNKK